MTVPEIMDAWPLHLAEAVRTYADVNNLPMNEWLKSDLVLALLRIDEGAARQAARQAVTELTGKPIQVCPSGMPPWPPKPVACAPAVLEPKISMVVENPCPPSTDMHRRFGFVRVGLTREQLIARGCQPRDIRYWQNKGHIAFA